MAARKKQAQPLFRAKGVSYSLTVQVNDRPQRRFAGFSLEELERDLAAAAAELGAGKAGRDA